MIYLTTQDLIHIARRVIEGDVVVRDVGLLESAAARPQASAFGKDAYASLQEKAAALAHSLARNHAIVDGNKRLALASTIVFLRANGLRTTWSNDEAYDLIVSIAEGAIDNVDEIADIIRQGTRPTG